MGWNTIGFDGVRGVVVTLDGPIVLIFFLKERLYHGEGSYRKSICPS